MRMGTQVNRDKYISSMNNKKIYNKIFITILCIIKNIIIYLAWIVRIRSLSCKDINKIKSIKISISIIRIMVEFLEIFDSR